MILCIYYRPLPRFVYICMPIHKHDFQWHNSRANAYILYIQSEGSVNNYFIIFYSLLFPRIQYYSALSNKSNRSRMSYVCSRAIKAMQHSRLSSSGTVWSFIPEPTRRDYIMWHIILYKTSYIYPNNDSVTGYIK